jgi:hypothetical protein
VAWSKSAAELDPKAFPALQWHVPGLLPEGFGLLVAPPKAGKSWMVAGVGLACALGGRAFGRIDVDARPVLYLAPGDGERRLQDRHRTLMGEGFEMPEAMKLSCTATPLTAPGIIAALSCGASQQSCVTSDGSIVLLGMTDRSQCQVRPKVCGAAARPPHSSWQHMSESGAADKIQPWSKRWNTL